MQLRRARGEDVNSDCDGGEEKVECEGEETLGLNLALEDAKDESKDKEDMLFTAAR